MSIEEVPLLTGDDTNPGYDETGEQIEMRNLNPYDSSRSGSSHSTVINRHSTQEETSFGGGISDTTSLLSRTESVDEAWDRNQRKFPNINTTLAENIDLNIETINNNNINIVTKSDTIRVSSELAQALGIQETLPPFSSVKISSDKKYLINCNLVETNSSYSLKATPGTVYPSRLLEVAPLRNECYPELSIESGKNIINNLTLEILTENLEAPDFGDNEITYALKVW